MPSRTDPPAPSRIICGNLAKRSHDQREYKLFKGGIHFVSLEYLVFNITSLRHYSLLIINYQLSIVNSPPVSAPNASWISPYK